MRATTDHRWSVKSQTVAAPREPRLRLATLLFASVIVTTLLPVGFLILSSFNVAPMGVRFQFGLDGWKDMLSSAKTAASFLNSLLLSVRVPIALVIGFVLSWLLVRVDFPGAKFVEMSIWLAFFLPALPMTMGWVLLLDKDYGLLNQAAIGSRFFSAPPFSINSAAGIIWVHLTLTTVPVMVLMLTPALRQFDASLEDSARMSGAGWRRVLWRVTMPLIAPAMITAFLSAFIRSLETFEVEQFLGARVDLYVYATRIYNLIHYEPADYPQAMAISVVFLSGLVVLALAYQALLVRLSGRATLGGRATSFKRNRPPVARWVVSIVLIALVCLTIFLPLAFLIAGSLTRVFGFFSGKDTWVLRHWADVMTDNRFMQAGVNSLALGLLVGFLAIFWYSAIAWVLARTKSRTNNLMNLFVWLPWAVPGLILGLSLLGLFLNAPGLGVFYGTFVPLVVGLLLKEMPIGVQMLRSSIDQTAVELEEAALMAGASKWIVFRRILLPIVAPGLVSVFLITFVSVIKDISILVLLATPGTKTLSLLMFDFASAGDLEAAAVIGLIIAAISLAIAAAARHLGAVRSLRS